MLLLLSVNGHISGYYSAEEEFHVFLGGSGGGGGGAIGESDDDSDAFVVFCVINKVNFTSRV